MNKKGQGPIGFIFLVLVFVIIWFIWLGSFVADWGARIVETNGFTGFEAFFFYNLNMVIFMCLILGILAYFYFGGGQ